MKIHVLDSGLIANHGHHDHFARGFVRFVRDYDCSVSVLAHRAVSADLRREVGALPVFRQSMYDVLIDDPYDGILTSYESSAERFAADLAAAQLTLDARDVLLLPTATAHELAGLARWSKRVSMPARIAGLFHWGTSDSVAPGTWSGALLRKAVKELRSARPSRMWFGATRQNLVDGLMPILERPVQLAPSVTFFQDKPLTPRQQGANGVTIAFLGSFRPAKGADLIPEIITDAFRENLPVRFLVQCHGSELPEAIRRLTAERHVELLDTWLSEDELAQVVQSADIVIMPYDRVIYRSMVSGVFTLAAGSGKACLVPSSTWMSDRIASGEVAGLCYGGHTAADIVISLRDLISQMSSFAEKAHALMPAWRSAYSGENVVRQLLEWAGIARRDDVETPASERPQIRGSM